VWIHLFSMKALEISVTAVDSLNDLCACVFRCKKQVIDFLKKKL
jgi:hypothetical protein